MGGFSRRHGGVASCCWVHPSGELWGGICPPNLCSGQMWAAHCGLRSFSSAAFPSEAPYWLHAPCLPSSSGGGGLCLLLPGRLGGHVAGAGPLGQRQHSGEP